MALIKCDECEADVSDKAVACPKCGNPIHAAASVGLASPASSSPGAPLPPPKPKPSASRKLGGALAAFLVAVIAFMVYESQSTIKATTDTSASGDTTVSQAVTTSVADTAVAAPTASALKPAPATAPPVIEISATELYEEYKANEVLADTKYKGRWLYVSGVVNEIGKDFTDDPYVNLFGENEYAVVRANFAKSAVEKLATLHKGDQISLMCQGKGRLIGDAILDCTSDDVPPAPRHAQAAATPAPSESISSTPADEPVNSPAMPAKTETSSYPTSFDCKKAHSTSEMLICGDADLAALDRELAQLYAQAKTSAPDKKSFAEVTTQNWIWREHNCRDKACLVSWYADQQQRFENILSRSAQSSAGDAAQAGEGASASL
ncbi:OB-fold protein [Pararobbsia alpina]|uniref:Zinc-ribbon domain-containing protein n=1 Tax=Pararobbsia alpina TaxID=621374 RepID=A0A6S7BF54_9BURK|nr:hypothetical protein [Pararobbsia alpina]CAB3797980.1 hypothetical protein LMG28138_04353 [Pararobbsia alpina]